MRLDGQGVPRHDLTHLQWRRPFRQFPQAGLAAVILLGACFALMRAFAVLGPQPLRPLLPFSFVLMAATPWLLLRHDGRRQIGLVRAASQASYVKAAITGALLALTCGALGTLLFDVSPDHWFVSIARSFHRSFDTAGQPTLLLFLAFAVPATLFSPLGEEIFFRGLLQRSLEDSLSRLSSTRIECGAFAVVHLCHHGLAWADDGATFLWRSGAVWMVLMFMAARLFAHWRQSTDSIFPAIVSHMAFNAAMSVYIFGVIWGEIA